MTVIWVALGVASATILICLAMTTLVFWWMFWLQDRQWAREDERARRKGES